MPLTGETRLPPARDYIKKLRGREPYSLPLPMNEQPAGAGTAERLFPGPLKILDERDPGAHLGPERKGKMENELKELQLRISHLKECL